MAALEILVDLRQMVVAIERAVSLVGMNDTNHGKRVGFMAMQVAHQLGFSEGEKQGIFELGMLHDCGVSSDSVHSNLVNQFDWELAGEHCSVGYELLKDFRPLANLALPILHHHTHWSELKDMDVPLFIKRQANIIYLVDRVDITAAAYYGPDILMHVDDIRRLVFQGREGYFDPRIVEAFEEASGPEAFWLALEDRHVSRFVWDMSEGNGGGSQEKLSICELKHLARIFSHIVDQKSPFTARHSCNVAALARYLAEKIGLSTLEVDKVEVAALLHDVGKLHIPDMILDKPSPLTRVERSIINQHSYETYEILKRIKGLEEIALWAAYHHDNCSGTGYPFHPALYDLPQPARIIAVSDVLQALVQDRPYRKGMGKDEVFGLLREMAASKALDAAIVEVVEEDADNCFGIARDGDAHWGVDIPRGCSGGVASGVQGG